MLHVISADVLHVICTRLRPGHMLETARGAVRRF